MPEQSSEAKEADKAVAKVKIDLKATKVNKKSVEFTNNNTILEQNNQIIPRETSSVPRDLTQVCPKFRKIPKNSNFWLLC